MCKKKGIIFALIPFFAFLMFSGKAEGASPTQSCWARIELPTTNEVIVNGVPHKVRRMKLGGSVGFCLDFGATMHQNSLLMVGACNGDVIGTELDNAKKALNWCDKVNCYNDNELYVIAQLYAWKGYNPTWLHWALCSWRIGENANLVQQTGPNKGKLTINYSTCGVPGSTSEFWVKAFKYSKEIYDTYTGGFFVCSKIPGPDGSGWQRILTKKKNNIECVSAPNNTPPPTKEDIYCPPDSKHPEINLQPYIDAGMTYENAVQKYCGEETAACIGYQWNLSGGLTPCADNNGTTTSSFQEVVGAGGADYYGDQKAGKKMDVNIGTGSYCAVYCKETNATAVLPGGIATPIMRGTALTWPTSVGTSTSRWGNMFPLEYSGKKECKVLVAPHLTYGNSCELEPVKEYKEYLNEMKSLKSVWDGRLSGLKTSAEEANRYREKSSELWGNFSTREITDTRLLLKKNEGSESIRQYDGKNTYLNVFETYNPGEDKFFAGSHQYVDKGTEGKRKATDAYNKALAKLQERYPGKKARLQVDPPPPGGTEPIRTYHCDDNCYQVSGDQCTTSVATFRSCNADFDWIATAKEKWEDYESKISERFANYNDYITAYQNATGIYHEIKMCANFGTGGLDEDGGTNFSCGGSSCDFYNFLTSATMEYEDEGPEYGSTHSLTIEQDTSYGCDGCESNAVGMVITNTLLDYAHGYDRIQGTYNDSYMQTKIDAIEKRTMHLSANTTTYSLPLGLYNYIDKDKNKFVMDKPSGNYQTLGLTKNMTQEYSNLPTSFNNIPGKKYNLIIKDIMLGDNGQFRAGQEGISFGDYVCHYEVVTDYDDCLCPPGTKWEDVDLYQVLLDSNGSLTCADAKIKWCDQDNIPFCKINCIEEKYCSNNKTIRITACVNSGKSKSECEALLCGLGKFKCPSNTLRKGMDITACVQTKVAQGQSKDQAVKSCESTICTMQNLFIYRTIDLRDPFPSADADLTISQNITHRRFNLNVKGRYPGSNWNGEELVKTTILNNRGVSGYDVYNQKPLYHIELSTNTILEIRAYNDKQAKHSNGYNDYTLSCVKDYENSRLGTSCYSSFVHNPKYGFDTTGNKSTCGGAGTTTSLGKCLYN